MRYVDEVSIRNTKELREIHFVGTLISEHTESICAFVSGYDEVYVPRKLIAALPTENTDILTIHKQYQLHFDRNLTLLHIRSV